MKVAILSANLGHFDTNDKEPVKQDLPNGIGITEVVFHRFTDEDFPPITGLTPRLQYRIPKLFGWQMFPGYDIYLWLDGGMSLERKDSLQWFLDQLGYSEVAFFQHPWRKTIKEEVEHIEDHLKRNKEYIVSRYKNGLHREFLELISHDTDFRDDKLYASTAFIYKPTIAVKNMMGFWWLYQSRYFSCDQVQLPYVLYQAQVKVSKIPDDLFNIEYLSLVSHHK